MNNKECFYIVGVWVQPYGGKLTYRVDQPVEVGDILYCPYGRENKIVECEVVALGRGTYDGDCKLATLARKRAKNIVVVLNYDSATRSVTSFPHAIRPFAANSIQDADIAIDNRGFVFKDISCDANVFPWRSATAEELDHAKVVIA